ncbi:glycosyltransferase involved in cell wall biosynthesis [Luteibacter rhizovicinus]|uniref:Glycosyltransferase involved in cell wall biosynthesis n=1 Tax=Luteibacter rhizovicinus TaxID=242606 RepID=A0A4R3YXA0_9GAMM|nr:glycosyltransferase family 4 protein [Luteibacter rhizovicinus]TCV97807.1 glycosyltransferase involved in cell wall biosynthesis [Luteibacter rhizovicinus]
MHVAQINVLPAPADCSPADLFERWPSLADIPEAAAGAGTRISVIQAAACDARLTRRGVDYRFTDTRGMTSAVRRARHFADLLRDIAPDVLHLHSLGFARDAFELARCLPDVPILIQDHADRPPPWWRRSRWRPWYAAASGIAFTAPALAQPFVAASLFGTRTRLFAIPESSSRFVPGNRASARAATGLRGDPCILSVGHLSDGKDPLTVIEGVALAAASLPDVQLWFAFGNAPLLDEVQRRVAQDPRLAGRVHLLGTLTHARIETCMQAADLFVSGSLAESCGYALLEALACGVAPVVTDIPAFRALTGDAIGEHWTRGDAAELAEILVRMAIDRPSPARVRTHFDATLSFAAVGRQWADAYAQLLDDRRRNAT